MGHEDEILENENGQKTVNNSLNDVSRIPQNVLECVPQNVIQMGEEIVKRNRRMSKAQFLIFLDNFVIFKLKENKENKENKNEMEKNKKNGELETTIEKSLNSSTKNLTECSTKYLEENSISMNVYISNYQSVYFSRLAGAIIRDSGNLKNHSEEERNNFNAFLSMESGSGSLRSHLNISCANNGMKHVQNGQDNNSNNTEAKFENAKNGMEDAVDVCGQSRVKPFPSFSEGIKVLEFFSGIGYVLFLILFYSDYYFFLFTHVIPSHLFCCVFLLFLST